MSRPVRKGRRHDYGACDRGGDCLACEREARRANEEADAEALSVRAPSPEVVAASKATARRVRRIRDRVADLAAALLQATPVPLEDDQAVKLALALVEQGWRKGRP